MVDNEVAKILEEDTRRMGRMYAPFNPITGYDHLFGQAADISTGNTVDNRRLFQLVINLGLPFTQLIDEHNFAWVHISYNPADLRHEIKRIR